MNHNYTRQRQGKDFPAHNHLANAEMSVEGNCNNIDGIIGNAPPKPGPPRNEVSWGGKDDPEAKTSMLNRLEYYKKVAERNAVPVDGHEPGQELPAPERGRD